MNKEQLNDSLKNSDKNFNENFTHEKEQIIIDDIDVSKCNHIIAYDPPPEQGTWGGAIHKGACKIYSKDCKYNSNCYFKQLARKSQEYEELKEKYEEVKEDRYNLNMEMYTLYRYRKALAEIKEYTRKQFCENCDDFNTTEYNSHCEYCEYYEYFDIINKANLGKSERSEIRLGESCVEPVEPPIIQEAKGEE